MGGLAMTKQSINKNSQGTNKSYHYQGCGLDNIYLLSGYEIVKDDDGEGVVIRNMDGLHRAIAFELVTEQKVLSGKEVRYLRTFMDLSQSGLGKLLGIDSQMIARYEKEQSEMPSPTDRLLRAIVLGHMSGKVDVQQLVCQIEEMESRNYGKVRFTSTKKGWKVA
jgi:putative transcriptional regulator